LGGIWYEKTCSIIIDPTPTPSYNPSPSPYPTPSPTPNSGSPSPSPTPTPTPSHTPSPSPSPYPYYKATVSGTLDSSSSVDQTTAVTLANITRQIISDKLHIDPSNVIVTVSATLNEDGTTAFSIEIKVLSSVVSSASFTDGLSSISADSIESSINSQGVNVRSGSVSITSNQQGSFAGKIVVSLLFITAVLLI
jgi:hypothetical protein